MIVCPNCGPPAAVKPESHKGPATTFHKYGADCKWRISVRTDVSEPDISRQVTLCFINQEHNALCKAKSAAGPRFLPEEAYERLRAIIKAHPRDRTAKARGRPSAVLTPSALFVTCSQPRRAAPHSTQLVRYAGCVPCIYAYSAVAL
jgi:hypothetical protein